VVLNDLVADIASVCTGGSVDLKRSTVRTHAASLIQTILESGALPSEDVIGVLAIAGAVAGAENEWLRSIRRPVSLVVECGSIPNNFQHELGNLDWMGRWASTTDTGASEGLGTSSWVGDVVLMIFAIEVLAIPACWEQDV